MNGVSEGDPIIGSDDAFSYLVANLDNKTRASFLILDNLSGSIVFREVTPSNFSRPVAYAPLGVGRAPLRGNWNLGGENMNDMLVWGELYVDGRWEDDSNGVAIFEGEIHYFQVPNFFDPSNITADLSTSSSTGRNKTTLTPPLVPSHGVSILLRITPRSHTLITSC